MEDGIVDGIEITNPAIPSFR